MYCRHCARQLADNAEFCVSCGQRPLMGIRYCQGCGAESGPGAVVCVRLDCLGNRLEQASLTGGKSSSATLEGQAKP
jgi:hypothetical protein